MATKSDKKLFVEQRFTTSENQNYNLNQSKKCTTLIPVQFNSKPNNDKYHVSDNYEEKEESQFWKKSCKTPTFTTEDNDGLKSRWKNENILKTANKSTLSLHISAYENLLASNLFGGNGNIEGFKREKFRSIKDSKQCFIDSLKSQNPFEFPRQQNGGQGKKPEVMQYKASQRLLGSSRSAVSFSLNIN
uniref:Uncharacterized protein n=1 Tax=Panagrolaimus sp. PS1159 TaxID=55785 RepID=A0AC35G4D4_9BILA